MIKHLLRANKKISVLILYIVLLSNLLYSQNNRKSDSIEERIRRFIPTNYIIDKLIEGKLNCDTLNDYVLVIKSPSIRDSIFLLVLFQKTPKNFEKNFELDKFVSEYDNNIEIIDNNILRITTITPWNGVNSHSTDIKYINNQWFYVGSASDCYDPVSSWSNSVNFITGVYRIKHDVRGKDNNIHTREIRGLIDKIGPISINEDCSKYKKIEYNGKILYASDRCDLWSYNEEELNK